MPHVPEYVEACSQHEEKLRLGFLLYQTFAALTVMASVCSTSLA